jgi:predicted ferric reductase
LIAATSPLIWYTTRASGVVALILLTASVCLGVLTTTRFVTRRLPRFAVSELHGRISSIAMVFVLLHVVTAVFDTYVPIGLPATLVPFTSGYRPLPVALGTVSFDLLLAVTVTSILRRFLNAKLWRGVHWLVYASWPIAFAHGLLLGTDLRFGWMQIVSGACGAAVLGSIGWRLWANPYRGGLRTAAPQGTEADTLPMEREPLASLSRRYRTVEKSDTASDGRVVARYTGTHRR